MAHLARITRIALASALSLSLAFPPAFAAKGTYVFRYNSGFATVSAGEPEVPVNPDQYDVTARFFGVKGEPFEARIPTKPGARVVSWKIEKGALPAGLTLDEATGTISGVPSQTVAERALSVRGYAPSGAMGTYASVKIDLVEVGAYARKQVAYGHTGKAFHVDLVKPSGVTVYTWTAETPAPDWVTVVNGMLSGTPPQAGTWPLAYSGLDYSGREVAFAYGQIVVEDGPQVGFIPNEAHHRDQTFRTSGQVAYSLGELRWELEGARPKSMFFDPWTSRLEGVIPTFDTSLEFRLKAIDVDGTSGTSNWFTFATLPAELDLEHVPTQRLTLNKAGGFSFRATDTSGTQAWAVIESSLPDGMSMDPSTGRVSGTPTKTGTWPGVMVQLTDASGTQQSNAFDVVVGKDELTATVQPVSARVGVPFTGAVPAATGGEGPYTYVVAEGSELPAGVTLDEATGVLSGTLSETGEQSPMLTAIDSTGYAGRPFPSGLTGYGPLSASVGQSEFAGERLTSMSIVPSVPEYSAMPPASWTLSPAAPPPGMAVEAATGKVSGAPTSVGTYGPYSLTVRDASGSTASTAPFTVKVDEIPDIEVQVSDAEVERVVDVLVPAGKPLHAVGQTTWELDPSSAALPSGLRLDPDGYFRGSISATAPVPGIVVKVTDAEGRSGVSQAFNIVPVAPGPMEMAAADLSWPAGVSFTAKVSPVNPAGEWSVAAAGLPAWLSLDPASGTFAGSAPSEGTFGPYSVTATDEMGRSATAAFTLTATGPLALSLQSPVEVHRLQAVPDFGPTASNAVGAVKWSLTGTLPKGLSFDASSGTVSGTAEAEGSSTVTFAARDGANQAASAPVTIKVGPRLPLSVAYDVPTLRVGASSGLPLLPKSPTNAALPAAFSASGTLPPGLALDSASGAIGGVPSQPGVFDGLSVSARDAEGETSSSGPLSFRVEPPYNMEVRGPVKRSMRLGTFAQTAPVAVEYAVPPVVFSTASGAPLSDPDGLTLYASTGSLSGVPHTPGTRSHSLMATDSMGRTASFTLELTAVGELGVTMANVAGNLYSPLPDTAVPAVTNAVGAVTYALSPATLPSGVAFSASTGRLSGTPAAQGTSGPYTLTAKDSTGDTATASFSIAVGPRLALEASFPKSSVLAVAHSSFSLTPKIDNAVGSVTWTLQSGTLPSGLSVDPGTGRLSGMPTELGSFGPITLAAEDSTGATTVTAPLAITVQLDGQPIVLVTKKLTWKQGMAFATQTPAVSNEIGDVYFRSPQAVALGLAVDSVTGVISGTVANPGSYVVDLNVTDSTNRVTSEPVALEVMPRLRLTAKPVYATVDATMPAAKAATADYALGAVTYAIQGTLPMGVTFSASGSLTGKPTQLGLFENLVVTATDSVGDSASSNPFTFEVLDNGLVPTITAAPVVPVLKAGVAMAGVLPAVSYKKPGDDVYTLNKPLPDGLTFNPSNGQIAGAPAPGSQGVYDGYVISVADSLGRGTSSDEFTVKVRHKDNPAISMATVSYRYNVPFATPAPTVTNGHAFVGTPVYSIRGTVSVLAGLSVDPATGVISGAISGNRSVTLAVTDDIGEAASTSVSFVAGSLTLSFVAKTFTEGQAVDYSPAITLATPDARFSWSSQVSGVMPAGLSMDEATGRVTGTMPFGTYFLKASVVDSGTTVLSPAGASYVKWVSSSPTPLSFAFSPLSGLENGAAVESEIRPVTGLSVARNASISGWAGELRTCYDADCRHEKATWGMAPTPVSNGEFVQMRSWAPGGSLESRTLRLTVASGPVDSVTQNYGDWTLTSKEIASVSASTVLPDVSRSLVNAATMTAAHLQSLYDGETATGGLTASSVTYDFGQPVSFDSFYISLSSTASVAIDVEVGGQMTRAYWGNLTGAGQIPLGNTWTGQRIKVSTTVTMRELRIGSGGPHLPPAMTLQGISMDKGSAKSVALPATASDSAYVSGNAVTFSVVSGNQPAGASLSPNGQYSLPSGNAVGPGGWIAKIRATDKAGFYVDRDLMVFSPGKDAATALPVNLSPWMYDGNLSSYSAIQSGKWINIDFGEYVTADKYFAALSSSSYYYALYAIVDGQPVFVSSGHETGATVALAFPWTARYFQIYAPAYNYTYPTEFRIGGGPAYAPPQIAGPSEYSLSSASSSVQLEATLDPNYTNVPSSPQPSFEVTSGTLPPSAALSPTGMLTLPDDAVQGTGPWTFTVKVTDSLGFSGTKAIKVVKPLSETISAATVLPTSVLLNGTVINAPTFKWLYDGVANDGGNFTTMGANATAKYTFPTLVHMDRVRFYFGTAATVKLDAVVDGKTVSLKGPTSVAQGWTELTFTAPIVTNSITLTNVSGGDRVLHDFMCGYVTYPAAMN